MVFSLCRAEAQQESPFSSLTGSLGGFVSTATRASRRTVGELRGGLPPPLAGRCRPSTSWLIKEEPEEPEGGLDAGQGRVTAAISTAGWIGPVISGGFCVGALRCSSPSAAKPRHESHPYKSVSKIVSTQIHWQGKNHWQGKIVSTRIHWQGDITRTSHCLVTFDVLCRIDRELAGRGAEIPDLGGSPGTTGTTGLWPSTR